MRFDKMFTTGAEPEGDRVRVRSRVRVRVM